MASKKAVICIHVFPSLEYIEIVQLDAKRGNIEKASSLPGAYEPITRTIEDTERLGQIVKDLYTANRIPLTTPAVLVLPSFFTREIDVPQEFGRDELRLTLTSEAERFYIFKKNEPQVEWVKINDKRVLYTAFPKSELEKYVQAFQDHKIPLLAVDLNYLSIQRGLIASGAVTEEISSNSKWCLLVVADYTFFAAICVGGTIEKTIEAPLSVGANDELNAIIEIQQDFDNFVGMDTLSKLVLVNNSERLDTEVLTNRLNFQEQVLVIEQNGKTLRSRGELNGMYPCSLEAIGGSLYYKFQEFPCVNLLPETSVDLVAIMDTQQMLIKVLWFANVIFLVLCVALWGLLSLFLVGKENDLKIATEQMAALEVGQDSQEVQRKRFIKKSIEQNRLANNLIVKLGSLIPGELWVENISLQFQSTAGTHDIEVTGGALTPELVNQFLNDVKKSVSLKDIELTKIDLATSEDGQSFYSWIIRTPEDLTKNR